MPTIALALWPLINLALFAKLPKQSAILIGLIGGYLFLPERFSIDLSGLPAIDKLSVILVALLLGLFFFREHEGNGAQKIPSNLKNADRPFGILIVLFLSGLILNMLLTISTNQEPISIANRFQPALGARDLVSMLTDIFVIATPFFIARKLFAKPEDHKKILAFILVAGLAYSLLILIEIRLSPRMHSWVYGYSQHSFRQHIRGNAFRPKVFLQHGLWVGLWLMMVVIAAGTLFRSAKVNSRGKTLVAFIFLLLVLIISRNAAATIITFVLLLMLWLGRWLQLRFAMIIAVIFLLYPAIRQSNILPLSEMTALAEQFSPARAHSLQFRFDNEDLLLERALKKPISGWGGWGRNRVYDDKGRELTVTDGLWIIQLGINGWVGYICFFGLLTAPIIALGRAKKRKKIPIETAALALIIAGNLIYLIPNSALSPIGWFLAGALAGFVQFDAKENTAPVETETDTTGRRTTYTRYPKAV